jgi:hypothetical protein
MENLNEMINTETIKTEMVKAYGSVYKYCKAFNIGESEVSVFLTKKRPISLRQLNKHAKNLKMKIILSFTK